MNEPISNLTTLADALFRGDAAKAQSLLIQAEAVDDQREGRCIGLSGVEGWVQGFVQWAQGLKASHSVVATLHSSTRAVLELSLSITVADGVVDLPLVLVADLHGDAIVMLRTYHSTWPYTGTHTLRKPPLEGAAAGAVPGIFARYIEQVSNADIGSVLESFTPDGYVREPSGDRWKHQGPEGRATFYGHLVNAPRATFDLNSCVVDRSLIAVEYSFAYGDVPMVGGVCIMEHEGGSIAAVRIADDVGA